MAATTKSTDKKSSLLYDSKSEGATGSKAFTKIEIVIESGAVQQYVGRAYKKSATGAKYWGERLDDYLNEGVYDLPGMRYRITAVPVTEDEFKTALEA